MRKSLLEITPVIPGSLARLPELAANLFFSWHRPIRALFEDLDPELWKQTNGNPRLVLRCLDQGALERCARDEEYLARYHLALQTLDSYLSLAAGEGTLVAYFCAEFGFHESFPIYSGGLGILAGDHCKAASDMRLPFIGVGLLYRQGYFSQSIDAEGNQHAEYTDSEFESLPITPVLRADGSELHVRVDLPGLPVSCKVWHARCGHVGLYLLDTDLPENDEHARNITHQLYGGDRVTRIEQEIVLGVGGVRALEALELKPTVWHINEGHAAFQVLERMRALVQQGLDHAAALEAVAAN